MTGILVKRYNQEGKEIGEVSLPKEIFGLKLNRDLVYQVVVSQAANRRKVIAKVKTRGEVKGGGRKPWRQKGTGRARVGSIRSPLWKGGGVVFGPTNKIKFKKKIPKKMKRKALFEVISEKTRRGLLIILDDLKLKSPKTKEILNIINKLPCRGSSVLVVLPYPDRNITLSARNIPKVGTILSSNLNCLDALSFKYFLFLEKNIEIMAKTFLKKEDEGEIDFKKENKNKKINKKITVENKVEKK